MGCLFKVTSSKHLSKLTIWAKEAPPQHPSTLLKNFFLAVILWNICWPSAILHCNGGQDHCLVCFLSSIPNTSTLPHCRKAIKICWINGRTYKCWVNHTLQLSWANSFRVSYQYIWKFERLLSKWKVDKGFFCCQKPSKANSEWKCHSSPAGQKLFSGQQ